MSNSLAPTTPYVGRFAPSPTGPLHFGSLITAIASYCDALAHHGHWLLRIEDTDTPRNQKGAESQILAALESFALHWHGQVWRQSSRTEVYNSIINGLAAQSLVYGCSCSRTQLDVTKPYPSYCANKHLSLEHHAVRLRISNQPLTFNDAIAGIYSENLAQTTGDFVLRRKDGIISYQLAVVVDDAMQGITHIVRGADLLDNTARQIWLQQCLNYPRPSYTHLPLVMNAQGQKLSKQNLAAPINSSEAPTLIHKALYLLGQPLPDLDTPERMLKQAIATWNKDNIPKTKEFMGAY